jgi:glycosyltransferase involved in cell wall biosynthesis
VAELVSDGESGWLVPPGDPSALAGAVRRLAAMPSAGRAEMGARGRATVRAEFDVDREAQRLAALFAGAPGDPMRRA